MMPVYSFSSLHDLHPLPFQLKTSKLTPYLSKYSNIMVSILSYPSGQYQCLFELTDDKHQSGLHDTHRKKQFIHMNPHDLSKYLFESNALQ